MLVASLSSILSVHKLFVLNVLLLLLPMVNGIMR
jgi:hypothetical protein